MSKNPKKLHLLLNFFEHTVCRTDQPQILTNITIHANVFQFSRIVIRSFCKFCPEISANGDIALGSNQSERLTTGWRNCHIGGKRFGNEEVEQEMRKWLRQQSKDFCVPGFDALVKRWDKCTNVGGVYAEKRCFLQVRISCFTFYIHLWPIYWLSLVDLRKANCNRRFRNRTDKANEDILPYVRITGWGKVMIFGHTCFPPRWPGFDPRSDHVGICNGQSGTRAGSVSVLHLTPAHYHGTKCSTFINHPVTDAMQSVCSESC
jgi:hypothetical protein